jgi:hypothetical protein
MNIVRRVLLTGAVLAGVACLAFAPRGAAAADPSRPFRGQGEGIVVGAVPLPETPWIVELTVAWEGTASHLGSFTRTDYLIVNFATGEMVGTKVFTAANGDELYVDTAGTFDPSTAPTPDEPLLISGSYSFTGGTGRFEGATGDASFEVLTPDFSVGALCFEGSLAY